MPISQFNILLFIAHELPGRNNRFQLMNKLFVEGESKALFVTVLALTKMLTNLSGFSSLLPVSGYMMGII